MAPMFGRRQVSNESGGADGSGYAAAKAAPKPTTPIASAMATVSAMVKPQPRLSAKKFEPLALRLGRGAALPYGVTEGCGPSGGVNFSIAAPGVESAWLLIEVPEMGRSEDDGEQDWPAVFMKLVPSEHKTGPVWHVQVLPPFQVHGRRYAWLLDPILGDSGRPLKSKAKRVIDPCARMLDSPNAITWNCREGPKFSPVARVPDFRAMRAFNWEGITKPNLDLKDLVIYEAHVRGFTKHPDSGVHDWKHSSGTFRGFLEKIPHLLRMGINCVELLPIFEYDETACPRLHPKTQEYLCNYWGYSTCSYYVPMHRFASKADYYAGVVEFKTLVRELHRYGIEVILDVVFNHTGEGAWGESNWHTLSAVAEQHYYLMSGKNHCNYTGCGNTVNANSPLGSEWICECLRYWANDMQVDGFRFDLASSLVRESALFNPTKENGQCNIIDPLFVKRLVNDPMMMDVKLIAEPWDCAWPDGYLVGQFPDCGMPRWAEWNGKYRDDVRKFLKGDEGKKGDFATRICGSADLYQGMGKGPAHSINFITAHDGFTLRDLVSYNKKNNGDNNEESGDDQNHSWNCGPGPSFDGKTQDMEVMKLRENQMRNFLCALFLSAGTPMLLMGDEYGRSQAGNNNTWCQDAANWFSWDDCAAEEAGLMRFCRLIMAVRQQHGDIFNRTKFFTEKDIQWTHESWEDSYNFISYILSPPAEGCSPRASASNTVNNSMNGTSYAGSERDAGSVAGSTSRARAASSQAGTQATNASTGQRLKLLVAFNAGHEPFNCNVPAGRPWYRLVDTNLATPLDICESDEDAVLIADENYVMSPYSCLILKSYEDMSDAFTYSNIELECGQADKVAAEVRAVAKRSLDEELLPPASSVHQKVEVHYEFDIDETPKPASSASQASQLMEDMAPASVGA
mmetsp:Transcript_66841/g.196207  ORF Transcript_66841/g.196207 Transcript_66841/m.196207 type:complete len:909 (+) Transcript_66841:53-2779(+)